MEDIVGRVKNSFDAAAQNVQKAVGVETDADLRNYRRLQQNDFVDIAKRFGLEGTVEYIEEMERRNIKGVRNG